jgi:hypothetical protein
MARRGVRGSRRSEALERSRRPVAAITLAILCTFALLGAQAPVAGAAGTAQATGFKKPFSGAAQYEPLAPPQIDRPGQLHRSLGQPAADRIARKLGLSRGDAFTQRQFRLFITGRGIGGRKRAARVLDRSVKIFINTNGHPLYSVVNGHRTQSVLASYGLFVTRSGLLESLANTHAPTRKANKYLEPGGYLGTWCINNGATHTLRALYRSAYTVEAAYGFAAQSVSGTAQLVTNTKGGVTTHVGMSMAPTIWMVNFALLYVLKPTLAAEMPRDWAPIPARVVHAIKASRTGQVRFSEFASMLP